MFDCCCDKHKTLHELPDGSLTEEPCVGDAEEQYSLGLYAGRWCERCWRECSGYRDESASAFDPMDAVEIYGDEY